jgi:signal transduction histidine kinase
VRPLDRITSIKMKIGVVIVAAVLVTVVMMTIGAKLEWPLLPRAAASIAVSLGMVHFLARGLTSPLRQMADAAAAMALGEHGRTVEVTTRDEVGELARAFNRMAAELAEVDRMRRDLVANVSHELRTPITALQAVLENLIDGVEPPDPATLGTMLTQVERISRLVTQVLDLSRLESGAIPLQRDRFAVRDLIEQAAEESRVHARVNRGAVPDVRVSVDPPDLKLDADPERIHQVVTNLLENALRHSPADAPVEIAAGEAPGRVHIHVTDSGPGIPDEEATRVFERFYRSDAARAANDGGSGLGLAIARWIVELHGGDIYVERHVPRGCRMVVSLPAR